MKTMGLAWAAACSLACIGLTAAAEPGPVAPLLEVLRDIGGEGKGNSEAAAAWNDLVRRDAGALPEILGGMDGANPLAANWIRAAVDAIAERTLRDGAKLPAQALEAFVLDREHEPTARRLAYEWLVRVDGTAAGRLIPGMLDDPSVELRREAVERLIEQARRAGTAQGKEEAVRLYQAALAAARDLDQVKAITASLAELGARVDLPRHFGFLMEWKLLGPFDNTDKKGFDVAYPPERARDFSARYDGKIGPVSWVDHLLTDDYGMVDLNKAKKREEGDRSHKGAISYCVHEFTSDGPREVELRLGTKNAWKLWLNGKLLFAREEYHRGMRMDQYRIPAALAKGKNEIMIKLCQNEQTESWAQEWEFQLRVCDRAGTAVLSTTRP